MSGNTIQVGIIYSLTGTMAISETPLLDVSLMAIAQINQYGGVLGKRIEAVIEDGASDPEIFRQKAQKLILQDQVATVFGCWTSLCRKAVLPVFEQHNNLLWYPLQYEGLEQSPNIFYGGSCPNQQVCPAVDWLLAQKYTRFYLIGSDYVFPRTVNKIVKGQLHHQQGINVGEVYVPLGETDFQAIVQDIKFSQPDVVFSSLNGDSNLAFYQQYQGAGITADDIPILALSLSEVELQYLKDLATGHVDPEKRTEFRELLDKQGKVKEFEYRCYCKNGKIIWVQVDARAVKDSREQLLYYEGMVQDITDRKGREDELRKQLAELKIEIDHKKRKKEVTMLTESTYFQEVQQEMAEINLDEFWS